MRKQERRYIVTAYDANMLSQADKVEDVRQGYHESSPTDYLMVRLFDHPLAEHRRAAMTHTSGHGFDRDFEPRTYGYDDAKFVFDTCPYWLQKRRYRFGKHPEYLKFDVFGDVLSGLLVAERKHYPNVTSPLPPWITGAVEVTDTLTNLEFAKIARSLTQSGSTGPVAPELFMPIPGIAFTGGPCSGKSELMKLLAQRADVHCMPELATILISQVGVLPPGRGDAFGNVRFQRSLSATQWHLENAAAEHAKRVGKKAMVFDRGRVDNAAYMRGGMAELIQMLDSHEGYELSRYSAVICLESAPEAVYEAMRSNNPARSETYAEACALGDRTRDAWSKHPNFHFIPNGGSWEEKKDAALKVVDAFLARI